MAQFPKKITDDPYGAAILIRRLVTEQGITYWRRYLTAFALMAVAAGSTAGATYVLGQVINQAYVDKNIPGIAMFAGITVLLLFIKGVATYGHMVILSKISNAILARNQRQLFAKLMSESIGFFSQRHSSEFLARLTAGAKSITDVLNMLVNAIGRDLLMLISMVAVMVWQDPLMSFIGLVAVPPAMLVLRKLVKRIKGLAYNQFTGTADIMETMQESLQGIRTVKAFTLEGTMQQRIDENIATVERNANKMAHVANRSNPLMEMLGGFAVAGCLMYGGYSVVALGSTPGQFFTFLTAFLMATEPAKRLARLNIDLNSQLVGARMLLEVVDSPASEQADDDKSALKLSEARIELRDVSFAYRPGEPVLDRMSFVAEPGKVTALVGPSGGGKSTVLALLLRFYETLEGDILIDGQSILSVSRKSLRQQTAYVGQDVYLFRDTIRANIAFGKPGATEAEIVDAAKAACAHDFIMSFPPRLRYAGRRAWHATVRRTAPAHRGRPCADQERTDHPARRGHRRARLGVGEAGAGGYRAPVPGPHHDRDRAPPAHHHARRCDPGGRGRQDRRARASRGAAAPRRPLRLVLPPAAPPRPLAAGTGADQRHRLDHSNSPQEQRDPHERRLHRHSASPAALAPRRRRIRRLSGPPHLVRRPQLPRAYQGDGQ
ncbi:subfamily B ATP-binding cassette protein MsbA [Bradyrhizobium embrapense]